MDSLQIRPKPMDSLQILPKPMDSWRIQPKTIDSLQILPKPMDSWPQATSARAPSPLPPWRGRVIWAASVPPRGA
eukprot:1222144-Pyramimonas_sp.AAC.1